MICSEKSWKKEKTSILALTIQDEQLKNNKNQCQEHFVWVSFDIENVRGDASKINEQQKRGGGVEDEVDFIKFEQSVKGDVVNYLGEENEGIYDYQSWAQEKFLHYDVVRNYQNNQFYLIIAGFFPKLIKSKIRLPSSDLSLPNKYKYFLIY